MLNTERTNMRPDADYLAAVRGRPDLELLANLHWNKYIPHEPTPRQRVFLAIPHREAFYGGQVGGGKSDALLMAALQYVDVPGYSGILFRRTFRDLSLPTGLIPRSHEWLKNTDARWDKVQTQWTFPRTGAVLAFGYLDTQFAHYRYQSAAFQFMGIDEASQLDKEPYIWLFNRMRRLKHAAIPIRMRLASNPGGRGHYWLRERFGIKRDPRDPSRHIGTNPNRPFIPAGLEDNPYLDIAEYDEVLKELDELTYAQYRKGDWSIMDAGRFKESWARYFEDTGTHYVLQHNDQQSVVPKNACLRFQIIDPAASAKEGPGDAAIWRGAPSWSVIGTFAITPAFDLLWIGIWREQCEVPDLFDAIKAEYASWRPAFIGIEASGLGIGVVQTAIRAGFPVQAIRCQSKDKLVRATQATVRMRNGKIWFPKFAPWVEELEGELYSWTGHPHDQNDQVDVLAYAAIHVGEQALGSPDNQSMNPIFSAEDDLPEHIVF